MILAFAHTPNFLRRKGNFSRLLIPSQETLPVESHLFSISYFLYLLVSLRGYFDDLRILIFIWPNVTFTHWFSNIDFQIMFFWWLQKKFTFYLIEKCECVRIYICIFIALYLIWLSSLYHRILRCLVNIRNVDLQFCSLSWRLYQLYWIYLKKARGLLLLRSFFQHLVLLWLFMFVFWKELSLLSNHKLTGNLGY